MRDASQPIRIAMVAHRFQRNDGQGLVNYHVARGAMERGFQVTLVTAHCDEGLAAHANAEVQFIRSERLPTQLARNFAFAGESAKWLKANRARFDLVQGNGFITWEPCDIITTHFVHSAWIRSPYFPFPRFAFSPYAQYQRLFTTLNSGLEKRAFRSARRIVAVSQLVADELRSIGVAADRVSVIHNGVDCEQYHPGPQDRASFGLPAGVPLALFVGEIRTPRKNLDTVLRALCRFPAVHLAVAGDDTDTPYRAMAADLGLADRVHFLGKIRNIQDLMRSADLFVFPSRYDTFGLVALEAMASALPVIISTRVGAAEVAGDACLRIDDPDDVDALSFCLSRMLESPELLQSVGRAARELALRLEWSNVVGRYLELYESMLQ